MFGSQILALRAQGLSYRQIVKELGCSKATVAYHCSKVVEHPLPKPTHPEIPQDTLDTLQWLLEAGVRKKDVADVLGLPYGQVLKLGSTIRDVRKDLTNYQKVKLRRRHLKMMAVVFKGGKCSRCGYSKSLKAFDFHHPNPKEKEFSVSQISNRSWSAVKREIAKCILLCANCHREEHDDSL